MCHPKEAWTQKSHWRPLLYTEKGQFPLGNRHLCFAQTPSTNPRLQYKLPKSSAQRPLCICISAHLNSSRGTGKKNKLANSPQPVLLHRPSSIPCWGRAVDSTHGPHTSTSPLCKCTCQKRPPAGNSIIPAVTKWRDHSLALEQSRSPACFLSL